VRLGHQQPVSVASGNAFNSHGPCPPSCSPPLISDTTRWTPLHPSTPLPLLRKRFLSSCTVIAVHMFKRNQSSVRCSTPTAPKLKSVTLPSFGGRGYETDCPPKLKSALKRTTIPQQFPLEVSQHGRVASSKIRNAHLLPEAGFTLYHEPLPVESKPHKTRPRNNPDSMASGKLSAISFAHRHESVEYAHWSRFCAIRHNFAG
jgi:hypothetical protein